MTLRLTLDRSGLLVASIPGVTTLPELPVVEPDDAAIDADYRKSIVNLVREWRAQQTPNTTQRDPSRS